MFWILWTYSWSLLLLFFCFFMFLCLKSWGSKEWKQHILSFTINCFGARAKSMFFFYFLVIIVCLQGWSSLQVEIITINLQIYLCLEPEYLLLCVDFINFLVGHVHWISATLEPFWKEMFGSIFVRQNMCRKERLVP